MLTVMTETAVKSGREADWDRAYHERAADARNQPGWVDLHLLVPVDDPSKRIVVGPSCLPSAAAVTMMSRQPTIRQRCRAA